MIYFFLFKKRSFPTEITIGSLCATILLPNIIGKSIARWRFTNEGNYQDYERAFEQAIGLLSLPDITKLLVVLDEPFKWDAHITELWKQTSELCNEHHIQKWPVSLDERDYRSTIIRYFLSGQGKTPHYVFQITQTEDEAIKWLLKED